MINTRAGYHTGLWFCIYWAASFIYPLWSAPQNHISGLIIFTSKKSPWILHGFLSHATSLLKWHREKHPKMNWQQSNRRAETEQKPWPIGCRYVPACLWSEEVGLTDTRAGGAYWEDVLWDVAARTGHLSASWCLIFKCFFCSILITSDQNLGCRAAKYEAKIEASLSLREHWQPSSWGWRIFGKTSAGTAPATVSILESWGPGASTWMAPGCGHTAFDIQSFHRFYCSK